MRLAFVHLSDIHFGQERNGQIVVNDDVKRCLIEDCRRVLLDRKPEEIGAVIVTGDIAYSGKKHEYEAAGQWLDSLTSAIGCKRSAVRIVPGNHDINRDLMRESTLDMLAAIAHEGEAKLDKYLGSEGDRDQLFARFESYRLFAEAYDCSLDHTGGLAGNHVHVLAPGRSLRFVGMNSALICRGDDDKLGRLLLGKRQWVLPKAAGEELVVLTHHPLHWFQDSEEAQNYVRSRARVYLSGHEHNPSVSVEPIENSCDLLKLAAGATVPPKTENGVNYCYNVLEFEWDEATDDLLVTVTPRAWVKTKTNFDAAPELLGGKGPRFRLGSPNFRSGASADAAVDVSAKTDQPEIPSEPLQVLETVMEDPYPLLLVRFFRDLSEKQRLETLVGLQILPPSWSGALTHTIERRCLDKLRDAGKLENLKAAIDRHAGNALGGDK